MTRSILGENVTLSDGRHGQVWAFAPLERDDKGRWRAMVYVVTDAGEQVLAPTRSLTPDHIPDDQLVID